MLGTGWQGELPPCGLRALPPRRARALPGSAAPLLPSRRRHVRAPADVRPGAVPARARRGSALRSRSAQLAVRTRRRGVHAALARAGTGRARRTCRQVARIARRRARGRRSLRRIAPRRRSSGSRSGSSPQRRAIARGRRPPRERAAAHDRPRDRPAQRRRSRAARAAARPRAGRARARVLVVAGTLATGEASMEYVADRARRARADLPALQREVSPRGGRGRDPELRAILREQRPDVLHTHTAKAGATGRIAALPQGRGRPRASVHTYHGHVLSGYFAPRRERVFRLIERVLAHATGALVAVSDEVRDDLVALRRRSGRAVRRRPLRLRPAALERRPTRKRSARLRAELGLAAETFAIGVGRPADRDQAPTRPRSHASRGRRGGRRRGARAGRRRRAARRDRGAGATSSASPSAAISSASSSRIRAWYAAFDASLLTSANEGTPVVAIESLAAERPVVATRAGGTGAVVTNGESGFLLPVGDTAGLARRLAELARDPELRQRARPTRRRGRPRALRDRPDGRRARGRLPAGCSR